MKATPFDHTATITLRHGDGTQSLYVLPSAHDVQRRHVCISSSIGLHSTITLGHGDAQSLYA